MAKSWIRGAGCIEEVHGVGVRQGGMEGLFATPKGTLEATLEKSLQPLFTMVGSHGGGGKLGWGRKTIECCVACYKSTHAKQIMGPVGQSTAQLAPRLWEGPHSCRGGRWAGAEGKCSGHLGQTCRNPN